MAPNTLDASCSPPTDCERCPGIRHACGGGRYAWQFRHPSECQANGLIRLSLASSCLQAAGAIQAYGMHAVVANLLPTRTTRVLLVTPPPPDAAPAAAAADMDHGTAERQQQQQEPADGANGGADGSAARDGSSSQQLSNQAAAGWRGRFSPAALPKSASAGSLRELGAGAAAKV